MAPGPWCPHVSKHMFVRKYAPKGAKTCTLHKPIPVPNLVGLSQADAIKALTDLKLGNAVVTKPSDGPPGVVVEQTPPAGTQVKVEDVVTIAISVPLDQAQPQPQPDQQPQVQQQSGQQSQQGKLVPVPSVVGLTTKEAENKLSDFSVSKEYRISDPPPDHVTAQRPPSGTMVTSGSPVTIIISQKL